MSNYKIGVNLRVTENSNQGGRKYMEDNHAIRFVKNDEGGFEFAYFGIFDGHGGGEASKFARDYLLDEITKYDYFWSDNDEEVLEAIKYGFLDVHHAMWKEVGNWPRTLSGQPSTSGTTASIAIIKNSKLYIGHVGDSGVALGYDDSKCDKYIRPKGTMLTIDHKPDSPAERKRIEASGGQVVAKSGVQRVVWNRPKFSHKGPIRRSTPIDKIPFLAVARSLGDLWSYNYLNEQFVVSPEPDVMVRKLDPKHDKCLVIGSDGLWNMMSAEEAVSMVVDLEYQFETKVITDPNASVSYWINPAEKLVNRALGKWRARLMKADNTSCLVVLIDPLGPRKLSILRKKREENFRKIREEKEKNIEAAKVNLRTSPRKSAESSKSDTITPKVSFLSDVPLPSPSASINTDEFSSNNENEKDSESITEEKCKVPSKSAMSPVSLEKKRRQSLPFQIDSNELDDSIQANSVHKKLSLTPVPAKLNNVDDICRTSLLNTLPVVDLSQSRVNIADLKIENTSQTLTKATFPQKVLSCSTRTRHASNPCISDKPEKSLTSSSVSVSARLLSLRDQGGSCTSPIDVGQSKNSLYAPVLTDSHKQHQIGNRQIDVSRATVSKDIIVRDGCQETTNLKKICDGSTADFKSKTNSELNVKQNTKPRQPGKIHVYCSARSNNNNSAAQICKQDSVIRTVVGPRSSLRVKKSLQKRLRQTENKHLVTRTRILAVKRKADFESGENLLSKRLCRR